ncbi:MAG: periplasmic heavy metal sensor [Alphaproteobacteria bacterium]|nr:periplasmic heavy metal sensor [Alphaproteobacteria bacterium]
MSEPTPVSASTKWRYLPELRSRWWSALLVASLMANLLVVGAVIGSRIHDRGEHGRGRFAEDGTQLLPRKFFGDLPGARRREFMELLRNRNDQFAKNREDANALTLKFADVLEQPDYDALKAKAAADEVVSGPVSFAAQGEALVLDIVGKLSPDERKLLAAAIRERAARNGKKQ